MLGPFTRGAAALLFALLSRPASAEGTFVSAPLRKDIVYDDARGVLYISNGGSVLRYRVSDQSFLTPISLGGFLAAMDISPDGKTLAVASLEFSGSTNWVHLVDLETLADHKVVFDHGDSSEGGIFSVAFGKDGRLLVTAQFGGVGLMPLRRYDPVHDTTDILRKVRQNTMLAPDASRKRIVFAEFGISPGPFGRYNAKRGTFRERGKTAQFLYEIAASRGAGLYALPTVDGTVIADERQSLTGTMLGDGHGSVPIAAVFHPAKSLIYLPWAKSGLVKVYDTNSWTQADSFDFEAPFGDFSTTAFESGRAKTSKDGRLLFVTVSGGVRFVETDSHQD